MNAFKFIIMKGTKKEGSAILGFIAILAIFVAGTISYLFYIEKESILFLPHKENSLSGEQENTISVLDTDSSATTTKKQVPTPTDSSGSLTNSKSKSVVPNSSQGQSSNTLPQNVSGKRLPIRILHPTGRMAWQEHTTVQIEWEPVQADFDHYYIHFGNKLVGVYGNPLYADRVGKTKSSLELRLDESVARMFLNNKQDIHSEKEIRENMFIRIIAEKIIPGGVRVVAEGNSEVFALYDASTIVFRSVATDASIMPVTTVNGEFKLRASKDGDLSSLRTDLVIPAEAQYFDFEFKFTQGGDGDYLTVGFNDYLLLSLGGDVFFGDDFQRTFGIPVTHIAGQVGVLQVTLHGTGTTPAEVLLKNFYFAKETPQ